MDKLYPNISDPTFNIKIAERKEFNENSYKFPIVDAEAESERLCSMRFELSPHQQFVKNYLSLNTPYNSLLLYHGLGTGKTCSAIGVSEEMRQYMKQMGISKKIIIVASPNVQDNFKQQLFDDRKMKKVGGIWNIEACSGNHFLSEINPVHLKGLSKEKIVSQVHRLIRNYYSFMGYVEFANFIRKSANVSLEDREDISRRKLENVFSNRLIVIDEVHNIRMGTDKQGKRVAVWLEKLVDSVKNLRLLFLSATPMYNDPREIVWLLNLMNKNDGRSIVDMKQIFDSNGELVINDRGEEVGKELLMRKATGYISFLRGDNPYTFPFRIFPAQFNSDHSLKSVDYPTKGLTGNRIVQRMEHLDLFCQDLDGYQATVYDRVIEDLKETTSKKKMPNPENMERFGYTVLQKPLEALNMVFPIDDDELNETPVSELVGQGGLSRIMKSKNRKNFEYRSDAEEKFGRIFSEEEIPKYSKKIAAICDAALSSEGICLVYSQFLDGGLIPIALALEERGCKRFGGNSLLKTRKGGSGAGPNINYVMITGDKELSPNNALAVKKSSEESNKDGKDIKIILISRAGSEGLDFKNIRQVHILEPWYNTNRLEQIIGRAVRTCSHIKLPFSKRNVMIFLYASLLKNGDEAADMYVYRVAEMKAILIGKVSRALKEGAVDCILNSEQMNADESLLKQTKELILANGKRIEYKLGDKPFSQLCDYMESCAYQCKPDARINTDDLVLDTYDIAVNETLIRKIKELFMEHYFYKKDDIIRILNYQRQYPTEQINASLDTLVNDKTELMEDPYERSGRLINIGEYYFFQPLELENERSSMFDRNRPVSYKRSKIIEGLPSEIKAVDEEKADAVMRDERENILAPYEAKYRVAFTKLDESQQKKKSDKDWYRNASKAIEKLEAGGMRREKLELYIMQHIWDTMSSEDKLAVLNSLFLGHYEKTEFSERLRDTVIENRFIKGPGKMLGIYLTIKKPSKDEPPIRLYVLSDEGWREAKKTERDVLQPIFIKNTGKILSKLNEIYGFIIQFKDSDELIYKTKLRDVKRQTGTRCDQSSKKETIKTLNEIMKSSKGDKGCPTQEFNEENTSEIGNVELCCYSEMVLRCYNENKVNKKIWFVQPEYSQIILEKLKEK
jgi:hypothetical protein